MASDHLKKHPRRDTVLLLYSEDCLQGLILIAMLVQHDWMRSGRQPARYRKENVFCEYEKALAFKPRGVATFFNLPSHEGLPAHHNRWHVEKLRNTYE